jgi:hypothetical protein
MRTSSPKARGARSATEAEGVTGRRQLAGLARRTRSNRSAPGGPGRTLRRRALSDRRRWRRQPTRLPPRPKAAHGPTRASSAASRCSRTLSIRACARHKQRRPGRYGRTPSSPRRPRHRSRSPTRRRPAAPLLRMLSKGSLGELSRWPSARRGGGGVARTRPGRDQAVLPTICSRLGQRV